MKTSRIILGSLLTLAMLTRLVASAAEAATVTAEKIRVLVVTGGHGFEKESFFKLFKDNPDITFQAVEHPNAYASLKAEAAKQWDVLVLYDMQANIPDD